MAQRRRGRLRDPLRSLAASAQGPARGKGRLSLVVALGAALVVGFVALSWMAGGGDEDFVDVNIDEESQKTLRVATWNIAAINNNPFEYWITYKDDKRYDQIMDEVQKFVTSPGDKDIPIGDVLTEERIKQLQEKMKTTDWEGVDNAIQMFNDVYKSRRVISEFLADPMIGKKRLVSMPDRVTNTVQIDGKLGYRPTVINCFPGSLDTLDLWWDAWMEYMFVGSSIGKPAWKLLVPINPAKYPDFTNEEAAINKPLQTIILAVFDSVLVHMMSNIASNSIWQPIRKSICENLNLKKVPHTLEILKNTYIDNDIIFIQEASASFVALAKESIGGTFAVLAPEKLNMERDQNSLILLRKETFALDTVQEFTDDFDGEFNERSKPFSTGDIFAIVVKDFWNRQYALASFHGDTNGLATVPMVTALHNILKRMNRPSLIFGLDANTYEKGSKKKQDMLEFVRTFSEMGMVSCWGDNTNPRNYTTFNARTYLQPQLNKASSFEEREMKGDRNPKDFILFYNDHFKPSGTVKDNTGKGDYTEDMVFPTITFPSDHALLSTTLTHVTS